MDSNGGAEGLELVLLLLISNTLDRLEPFFFDLLLSGEGGGVISTSSTNIVEYCLVSTLEKATDFLLSLLVLRSLRVLRHEAAGPKLPSKLPLLELLLLLLLAQHVLSVASRLPSRSRLSLRIRSEDGVVIM